MYFLIYNIYKSLNSRNRNIIIFISSQGYLTNL